MATIAEFIVPSDAFPLGAVFDDLPDVTVELDRVVPTNKSVLPYFWVTDGDAKQVLAVIADHPELKSVTIVEEADDNALFRAEWNEDVEGIVTAFASTDVTLLSAVGMQAEWIFELRAEDAADLSAFKQYCRDRDIDITLTRLQSLAEVRAGREYDLTDEQREALLLAFEKGYYDDSRRTNLGELATELGITRQSFSDRLRRGYRNLVGNTIADQSDGH